MSISLTFHCGGCDATAPGTDRIRQRFEGTQGNWGFGHHVETKASDLAPEGWVAFDLIGATYCPKCADDIWPPSSEERATGGKSLLRVFVASEGDSSV